MVLFLTLFSLRQGYDGDGEEVWVWARGLPRLRCGLNGGDGDRRDEKNHLPQMKNDMKNTTSLLIPSNVKTDPRNSPKPSSTTTSTTAPMAPTSLEHLLVQMEDSIVKMQGMLLECYSTRVNDGICGIDEDVFGQDISSLYICKEDILQFIRMEKIGQGVVVCYMSLAAEAEHGDASRNERSSVQGVEQKDPSTVFVLPLIVNL
ncbi:uncharacterized protein LOC133799526 [Humulus lupulus]|uniref:uncharacterized protein LOC133799526 n=1 Tax=Humulus lupulus TaxID=3486 RepID=UPI002B41494A|nr:uncharacterized protein LOC133799526 [Humulus lupulus]